MVEDVVDRYHAVINVCSSLNGCSTVHDEGAELPEKPHVCARSVCRPCQMDASTVGVDGPTKHVLEQCTEHLRYATDHVPNVP